jgi:single-stranded DNA-binding protein
MMQVITIVGNIVDDAELRKSKDGNSQFISFRVAVTENRGDDRKTTYYDVTHPSTGVLHFLKKGKAVSVVGPLSIWQSHGQDFFVMLLSLNFKESLIHISVFL